MNQTIDEIDHAHSAANAAMESKDLVAYLSHFSADLKYRQGNGKVMDKKQLSDDVRKYFDRIKGHTSTYDRLESSFDGDLFVETLVQKATATLRVFIFFSKKWTIEREGRYEWRKTDGKWEILNVEVLREKVD